MQLLSYIIEGAVTIKELSEVAKLSKVQIYRTVASLQEKKAIRLEKGEIIFQNQPHIYSLTNLMHDASAATSLLAGNGLDIIREMREPRTAAEVAERLGISERTVSRTIKRMRNNSMLSKEGDRYVINDRIWHELRTVADRYADYSESFDARVPSGSRIYHRSKSLVIFSDDRDLGYTKTALSRFEEYGIKIFLGTQYYCTLPDTLTIGDIFLHSLEIISLDKNWRMRMMALIFYKKYRDELKDIKHPMKDEMELVLENRYGKVKGRVPLKEMQTRAEIYDVDLYDIYETVKVEKQSVNNFLRKDQT
jgi:predicted transcriptional regulator